MRTGLADLRFLGAAERTLSDADTYHKIAEISGGTGGGALPVASDLLRGAGAGHEGISAPWRAAGAVRPAHQVVARGEVRDVHPLGNLRGAGGRYDEGRQ